MKAPGTTAVSTPAGTSVTAPGTKVTQDNASGTTRVNAPGTSVVNDKAAGYTVVNAPGTQVATNQATGATEVIAPFVGRISVPGRNRKLMSA